MYLCIWFNFLEKLLDSIIYGFRCCGHEDIDRWLLQHSLKTFICVPVKLRIWCEVMSFITYDNVINARDFFQLFCVPLLKCLICLDSDYIVIVNIQHFASELTFYRVTWDKHQYFMPVLPRILIKAWFDKSRFSAHCWSCNKNRLCQFRFAFKYRLHRCYDFRPVLLREVFYFFFCFSHLPYLIYFWL